ncbi:MAG: toll/interleukin-1 receptor domain-containing protein [Halothiobacillus sp.]|jgi:hypothetical protein|nr:toll/interleukin-1 receptor domain-containing protein [Halothiobacillus sp.]
MDSGKNFQLPDAMDKHFGSLAKLYQKEDKRELLSLIANSRVRVHEAWSVDNWNGCTWGHAIYLYVPEQLFLAVARRRDSIAKEIVADLNSLYDVPNEYVSDVFIEMEDIGENWREESGAMLSSNKIVPDDAISRLWGANKYRVFISHKADDRGAVSALKDELSKYGIAAFVAHEDIVPTTEWQNEIENALNTMDTMVAFMTPEFHDSDWTDQELGIALGKNVPIIALRLGKNPYGFIGKVQALTCDPRQAPLELVKLLIHRPKMLEAYIEAACNCESFIHGNELADVLPYIEDLTDDQVNRLIQAMKDNYELRGSYGFNGNKLKIFGPGLAHYLSRITGKTPTQLGFRE